MARRKEINTETSEFAEFTEKKNHQQRIENEEEQTNQKKYGPPLMQLRGRWLSE